MKRIPLTQGKFATVDNADYVYLRKYKWHTKTHNGTRHYAARQIKITGDRQITVRMHRQILGLTNSPRVWVDHKNGNGLDNRKCNIRKCSPAENARNCIGKNRVNRALRGITPLPADGRKMRWRAVIKVNWKPVHLGCFRTQKDAAHAYDEAAKKYHGEYARLNFPNQ